MRDNRYEQGHTSPMTTLAIFIILGIFLYLGVDTFDPDDPSSMTLGAVIDTWLGWSWWAKLLSTLGPVLLFFGGSALDSASRFTKLPPDE